MKQNVKYDVTEFYNNISEGYDDMLNRSIPAGMIRNYFQNIIIANVKPGEHLLEIVCGTGTDAIFIAGKDIKITSTDISENMLMIADKKIQNSGLSELIKTEILDADNLASLNGNLYDGLISNFNAINYILKPGAKVFFVMLNKLCLWEVFYNLLKLKPVTSFERLLSREKDYKAKMQLYFPGRIKKIFSKNFQVNKIRGFGFLFPSDGLSFFIARHRKIFNKLQGLENCLCSKYLFYNLCDHFFIEMKRK